MDPRCSVQARSGVGFNFQSCFPAAGVREFGNGEVYRRVHAHVNRWGEVCRGNC